MSNIQNYLTTHETVIDRIVNINLNKTSYDCTITNYRLFLFKEDKKQFIDIEFEKITQISLEKEWYDEFFLASIICLIIGLIWSIAGLIYRFIDDPSIMTQIIAIRALIYPGIVFLCFAIAGLCIYYKWMKIHVQILTSQDMFQLYSNPQNLKQLLTLYEKLTSGDITSHKPTISGIPDEQRLSEQSVATFNDMQVKITYKDAKAQKNSINLKFNITFTENFIHLISKRVLIYKKSQHFKHFWEEKKLPLITEANLYKIYEIARELNINWILLTNFNFQLQNISLQTEHFLTGSIDPSSILLIVESFYGQFTLELNKPRFFTNAPAQEIVEIKKIIQDFITN